jgi:hypothetical protein
MSHRKLRCVHCIITRGECLRIRNSASMRFAIIGTWSEASTVTMGIVMLIPREARIMGACIMATGLVTLRVTRPEGLHMARDRVRREDGPLVRLTAAVADAVAPAVAGTTGDRGKPA